MANVVDKGMGIDVVDSVVNATAIEDVETSTRDTIVLEEDSDCA